MLISMTGFSSKIITLPIRNTTASATLTLKSLNSRFFEANCRLPYALTHIETECIKIFKQQLYRGSVYFTVHLDNPAALKTTVTAAFPIINGYIAAAHSIQKNTNIPGTFTISDLVTLPHVFEASEEILTEETTATLLHAVKELALALHQTREQEGLSLKEDLENRIRVIREAFTEIKPRAQIVAQEKKVTLMSTLQAFTAETGTEVKDQQLQFIQNQLDKIDIHEEIVRFEAHLNQLQKCLTDPGIEKGKKIDFTLQELFREINTMSSKCADTVLSNFAITIKVELEKAREQAQNIV